MLYLLWLHQEVERKVEAGPGRWVTEGIFFFFSQRAGPGRESVTGRWSVETGEWLRMEEERPGIEEMEEET